MRPHRLVVAAGVDPDHRLDRPDRLGLSTHRSPDERVRPSEFCEYAFNGFMSGPFGEEAPGQRMSLGELAHLHLKISRVRTGHPHLFPNAWFDFHSKRGGGIASG